MFFTGKYLSPTEEALSSLFGPENVKDCAIVYLRNEAGQLTPVKLISLILSADFDHDAVSEAGFYLLTKLHLDGFIFVHLMYR